MQFPPLSSDKIKQPFLSSQRCCSSHLTPAAFLGSPWKSHQHRGEARPRSATSLCPPAAGYCHQLAQHARLKMKRLPLAFCCFPSDILHTGWTGEVALSPGTSDCLEGHRFTFLKKGNNAKTLGDIFPRSQEEKLAISGRLHDTQMSEI